MIFRNGKPLFKTTHMEPLWSSKITGLKGLKDCMLNNILVAFDIEASPAIISEMGLAILLVVLL